MDKREKTWANLVVGNKFAARGMNLTFIALTIQNGEKILELQQTNIEKGTKK